MKIAITADNHLTTQAKNPERFAALSDIFRQCGELDIQLLIIAGDLFDQSLANYAEFEDLYQASRPEGLTTVIIPGNHDQRLHKSALAGADLIVYSDPIIRPIDDSRFILFLPYQDASTMGEAIAPFLDQLTDKRWILVGHGDWSAGYNAADPYEPGSYMPLTAADIKRYQPEIVLLGHIHLPQKSGLVYYPGSPCPLNINETGTRRFLILDTERGEITSQMVNSHLLYFQEQILMLPVKNDLELLEREILERINSWGVPQGWENQVHLRLKISGCAHSDRDLVLKKAQDLVKPFHLYRNSEPDLANLVHSQDQDKAEITRLFKEWLDKSDWEVRSDRPGKTQILEEALRIIYQAAA